LTTARRPAGATLWYDAALPLKLGCTGCPDLAICRGLRIQAGVFDCRALRLRAGRPLFRGVPAQCTALRRAREVDGFALDNVPRKKTLAVPDIRSRSGEPSMKKSQVR
jgi:hypothetical protein